MTTLARSAAMAAVLIAAATPAAFADPVPADSAFQATTLDLSAVGEAHAQPDMATINLGVTEDAPDAAGAMRANSEAMAKVVAALRAGGVEDRDIQTSNLNLNPQYVYEQNKPPRLTGYQASNQVTVTVRDLARLGPAVDAVVSAGATNVGAISFGLKAPLAAENAAREAAVKALQDKASLYAEATGYHIKRLVSLSEGGGYAPSPRPLMAMARVQGVPVVPVESGDLTVRVDVSGVYELSR